LTRTIFIAKIPRSYHFCSGPRFSISLDGFFSMFEDKSPAPSFCLVVADGSSFDVTAPVIRLCPIDSVDEPFLYRTFASTRTDEMALTGWNKEQQEAFLRMQYEAQRRAYLMQIPDAEYWVIRRDETAVGGLIIDRTADEIHVVDIALLPEFRAQGIGSTLMEAIMTEAKEAAKAVRLHVERFNPALGWYERLGFSVVNSGPIYLEMVWRPCSAVTDEVAGGGLVSGSESEVGMTYVNLSD
jgi:ribosomal protein S18 acetylase RimI-like enzyme